MSYNPVETYRVGRRARKLICPFAVSISSIIAAIQTAISIGLFSRRTIQYVIRGRERERERERVSLLISQRGTEVLTSNNREN